MQLNFRVTSTMTRLALSFPEILYLSVGALFRRKRFGLLFSPYYAASDLAAVRDRESRPRDSCVCHSRALCWSGLKCLWCSKYSCDISLNFLGRGGGAGSTQGDRLLGGAPGLRALGEDASIRLTFEIAVLYVDASALTHMAQESGRDLLGEHFRSSDF